jgi:hypothetical protein
MRKKRTYTWYVEPLSDRTNEAIARGLGQEVEESFDGGVLIPPDSKRHNLWRCPFSLVSFLFRSKDSLGLEFLVYNREGQGKIRKIQVVPRRRKKTVAP